MVKYDRNVRQKQNYYQGNFVKVAIKELLPGKSHLFAYEIKNSVHVFNFNGDDLGCSKERK